MATTSSSKRQLIHTSNTYESNSDLTVGGDLFVNGATTTIDTANLLVEDKNIIIGNVSSPSDTTADGGGITLKGASDYTINWTDSTNQWYFNQGINITGQLDVSTNLNVGGYGTLAGLDINGNSQFDGAVTVGVDDTGHDVKFFGATAGRYLLWDESANALTGFYDLKLADSRELQIGGSNDLRLYHSHPHSYIVQGNSGGSLYIRSYNTIQLESSDGEDMITCAANGAVTLHYDAASHLQTTQTGVNVTGKMTSDTITTAGNLELFESGNNNYISSVDSGKHLLIRNTGAANVELLVATSEKALIAIPNGAVQLYHDNALKLTTTAGGADVSGTFGTGHINLDGELNFTTNGSKYIDANTLANSNTFNIRHHNPSGNAFQTAFQSAANGGTTLYHSGNAKFATTTDGIQLYGNGYIDLPDNGRARFGGGFDLAIYHSGVDNNNYIDSLNGRNLRINSNGISLRTQAGVNMITATAGGSVALTYNGGTTLETVVGGIKLNSRHLIRNSLVTFANGVANQKVDLYWTGTQQFWGEITVTVQSTYSNQNAAGSITKKFYVGLNPNNSIFTNECRYTDAGGVTGDNFAISDLRWDSTNSRYYITIVHRVSTGNQIGIKVEAFAKDFGYINNIDDITTGSVYTTDTTTYAKPYIYYNDNVGIGTTDPLVPLHVQGTALTGYVSGDVNADTMMVIENDDNARLAIVAGSLSDLLFGDALDQDVGRIRYNHSSDSMAFFTAGVECMRIEDSGEVGIGTTSPNYLLDVEKAGANMRLYNLTNNGNTDFHIRTAGTTGQSRIFFGDTADPNTGAIIYRHNGNSLSFKTNDVERMRINSSGSVGIGTTSPDSLLHLQSASATGAIINLETTHSGGIPIYNLKGAHSAQLRYQDENGNNQSRIDFLDGGDFNFIDATDGTSHLKINSNGNIGIGTTSPVEKLQVDGYVRTKNSKYKKYTSLSGSSNDWFPIYQVNDHKGGQVTFTVNTYAHSSCTFVVSEGYGPSGQSGNPAHINVLNYLYHPNGGYANITGIRVNQIGMVEIKLTFTSGPTVHVAVRIESSEELQNSLASSLATSTSSEAIIDTVSLSNKYARFKSLTVGDDGTNSLPSLNFGSSGSTGLYYDSANSALRLSIGGTQRASFSSAGIFSTANVYSGTNGQFRNYSGVWKATTGTSGNGFQFISADATAMVLSSTGSMDVTNNLTANSFIQSGNTGNTLYAVSFGRSNLSESNPDMYGSGDTLILGADADQPTLVIRDTEKVGIGTASPVEKLEVAGNIMTRNGTTATKLNLYESYSDSYNYELTSLDHSGGYFEIDTGALGSGNLSGIKLSVGSHTKLQIEPDGHVLINGANDNGNKADFAVGTGGHSRVSWHGTQVQIGANDMNYNGAITHDGTFRFNSWASDYTFHCNATSGTAARDISFSPFNGTATTLSVIFKGDGNVGIGTSSPSDLNGAARRLVVGSGSGNEGITIYSGNSSTSSLYLADGTSGDQAYRGYITYSHSAEKLSLGAGGITRITATNGGLVGIGTTNPAHRLDVVGTYRISDNTTNANNKLHRMLGRHYTNAEQDVNIFSSISTSSTNVVSFGGGSSSYNTATHILFYTASNNTSTYAVGQERFRIHNDGNIGIAVGSPQQKLDVDGAIKSKIYTVNTLPTANSSAAGARAFVSDSQMSASGNFGATIAGYGSGSYTVPVWCDGAYWYIG